MKLKIVIIFACFSMGASSVRAQPSAEQILSTDLAIPSYAAFEDKVLSLVEEGKRIELSSVTPESRAQASNLYNRLLTLLEVYRPYPALSRLNIGFSEAYDLLKKLSEKFSLGNIQEEFIEPDIYRAGYLQYSRVSSGTLQKIALQDIALNPASGRDDMRFLNDIASGEGPATQTEAFLKRPFLRAAVEQFLQKTPIPTNLIGPIIGREKSLPDYDVFYHAQATIYVLFQDIITEVLKYTAQHKEDPLFYYLRIPDQAGTHQVLADILKKGFNTDHDPRIRNLLLSVNLSLFGNILEPGESTIDYFVKNISINSPYGKRPLAFVQGLLQDLDLSVESTFIDELADLYGKYLSATNGNLLQIFIPKDKVNDYVYLSFPYGVPLNCSALGSDARWKGCSWNYPLYPIRIKDAQGKVVQSYDLTTIDPRSYLDIYRNHPTAIMVDNMDAIQARILLTSDFLLNPASGAKIYRYMITDSQKLAAYKKELKDIIERMMSSLQSKQLVASRKSMTEPLSKQLALTTSRQYEKAVEDLLGQGERLLAADATVENSQKALDVYVRLSAIQEAYSDRYGTEKEGQKGQEIVGLSFYEEDSDAVLSALTFKFDLETVSPYQRWKLNQRALWQAKGIDSPSAQKIALLNSWSIFSLLRRDKDALYSYNFLREFSNLSPVFKFSQIDLGWLADQDYRVWKEEKQKGYTAETPLYKKINNLIPAIFTYMELYEKHPYSSDFGKRLLYLYNFLRELLHVPKVSSAANINMRWLAKEDYKASKEDEMDSFKRLGIVDPAEQKRLLTDTLNRFLSAALKAPDDRYLRQRALNSYNLLREIEHLPPFQSWEDMLKLSGINKLLTNKS